MSIGVSGREAKRFSWKHAPRLELVTPDPFSDMHVVAMHFLDVFRLHRSKLPKAWMSKTLTGTPSEYLPHIASFEERRTKLIVLVVNKLCTGRVGRDRVAGA